MNQLSLVGPARHDPAAVRQRLAGRSVVASVSGGRDSAAMSLYLHELGIEHERVFMDTGWEHPLTYEYLRGELTRALGPIIELRSATFTFESLVRHKGLFPSRVMRFCTEELKVKPMQEHVRRLVDAGGDLVNCVGIRRAESRARSEMAEWEFADGFDCEVWRPLVLWSVADVQSIHARHGLATNPLYRLGASRVGCWPCIHARKAEVALVAKLDPARIDLIDGLEHELTESAREKATAKGEALEWERSMFSYGGGGRQHVPLPIYSAVEWSNSGRGEWQPDGAGEGCMRFGLCETAPDADLKQDAVAQQELKL